ncbi:hypothetical protein EC968_003763 [Mortierella alpina]|nr:hypothetical protein EC968_003763 [Mortierella alpina]
MDKPAAATLASTLVVCTAAALVTLTLVFTFVSASADNASSSCSSSSNTRTKRSKNRKQNDAPQYVTGLVNVGNTCFMNSVLQALASLPSLHSYLEARRGMGHDPDSITLALDETVEMLNVLHRRPTTKRLVSMIKAVREKASHVLTSQQQDAQELFQILSSQLSEEREKLDHPTISSLLDRTTVSEILNPSMGTRSSRRPSVSSVMSSSLSLSPSSPSQRRSSPSSPKEGSQDNSQDDTELASSTVMSASVTLDRSELEKYQRAKSPFMGLLASRVSCVDCGYTYSCTLEDCLYSFIHLDTISDFNCRKCTLVKASRDLGQTIQQVKEDLITKEERDRRKTEQQQDEQGREPIADQVPSMTDGELEELSQPIQQSAKDTQKLRRRSGGNEAARPSKRLSLAELSRFKDRIDYCLQTDIEMDLSPLELTPVRSKRTTKHSMIAKPPQTLCLHLNRSMITPTGQMSKNSCRVQFRSRLDFTSFTTSGHLTTVATKSMSTRRGSAAVASFSGTGSLGMSGIGTLGPGALGASAMFARRGSLGDGISPSPSWSNPAILSVHSAGVGADPSLKTSGRNSSLIGSVALEESDDDRVWYRLCAVVVHLGSHNSGHFVTYRRISPARPPSPLSSESSLAGDKRVREEEGDVDKDLWWRISDEDVQIVDWSLVRAAEAYMLFYEKEH